MIILSTKKCNVRLKKPQNLCSPTPFKNHPELYSVFHRVHILWCCLSEMNNSCFSDFFFFNTPKNREIWGNSSNSVTKYKTSAKLLTLCGFILLSLTGR